MLKSMSFGAILAILILLVVSSAITSYFSYRTNRNVETFLDTVDVNIKVIR